MVGGFESAGRLMSVVGAVMEAAVGEGAAEPLVEEQEEKRHLDPFRCEPVGVAGAVALQQPVAFELAQVVAELVQAVGTVGEVKAGENSAVDLFSGPAAEMTSAVQENFEEADDARVVDLDPRISDRADTDRKGETLQQREVDMNIEPLRLEAGKASGDSLEALAHGFEMVQPLLQAEIGEIVGDQLVAQKGRELFVLFQEGVFEVGAEDVMAVLAAAFEQLVDREVALEDEVAAILDLGDRIKA